MTEKMPSKARWIYSVPMKLLAYILSLICIVAVVAGIILLGFWQDGYYSKDGSSKSRLFYNTMANYSYMVFIGAVTDYINVNEVLPKTDPSVKAPVSMTAYGNNKPSYRWQFPELYNLEFTNLRYRIYADGELLPISTYHDESYSAENVITEWLHSDYSGKDYQITIESYLVEPLSADDYFATINTTWEYVQKWGNYPIWIGIGALVLWIILQVYLLCAAGHKRGLDGTDTIVQGGIHRIPFDILTIVALIGAVLLIVILNEIGNRDLLIPYSNSTYVETMVQLFGIISAAAAVGYSGLLVWGMSMAVRIKKQNLFSGMVTVRILRWIGRGLKGFAQTLPQVWLQTAAIVSIVLFIWILIAFADFRFFGSVFFGGCTLLIALAAEAWIVSRALYRKHRQEAISRMAAGDLSTPVALKAWAKKDRQEAKNLSRIHDTVSVAVEKQLQSERLKSELITNVSHDIKTPLTSIINYVDLMQKEGSYTEKQQEYLEVLEKQSIRLKKLIEDLIEASKASTGNIKTEMMPICLEEMLRQVTGEYTEKLEKAGLSLVMKLPEKETTVLADGRLLSRVFDNLLSNVIKYSQPGTRVYLDLGEGNEYATVSIRNISNYPLNISESELMERFSRGDSSRHTEGSGLGLGIALSLVELMQGKFRISIDGDLFKAMVSLRKWNSK
ncbi:MAG: HAMP domain-containing histidine kinase [Firmicutes bacterium]|nr:HAMP domain-containing histidine kinase [Bacillota bacterium]